KNLANYLAFFLPKVRPHGDQTRYELLQTLGWDYAIRFRQAICVTNAQRQTKPAVQWLLPNGRARMLKDVKVTTDNTAIPAVVVAKAKDRKEPWCIATSRSDLTASQVVKLYARRFRIEERFRDTKDIHFGMGLSATHIGSPVRRDRLLFLAAFAFVLLTLLAEAGERAGLDRYLKANTSKKRTMSLYNQGFYWFMAIPNMKEERLERLVTAYAEVLQEHRLTREILGIIGGDGSGRSPVRFF
ncbi:MAG TPA: transposase, partial [Polyangiaceae bacterium]|nr:transposase [Polyangiaceae bacterium]